MIDLGNEEIQREPKTGPVPAGSRVLVRLRIEKPQFAAADDPFVAEGKSGLRRLQCKVEVVAGAYDGCWWYDGITLPEAHQNIPLSPGQKTACRIGGSMLRAIVESSRGINPKDSSIQAATARRINAWTDLDGMEIPVRVGIDKTPFERDGRYFWNNRITSVVPASSKEWQEVKNGGEIITDGPVAGKIPPKQDGYTSPPANYGSDTLYTQGSSEMDGVPF